MSNNTPGSERNAQPNQGGKQGGSDQPNQGQRDTGKQGSGQADRSNDPNRNKDSE